MRSRGADISPRSNTSGPVPPPTQSYAGNLGSTGLKPSSPKFAHDPSPPPQQYDESKRHKKDRKLEKESKKAKKSQKDDGSEWLAVREIRGMVKQIEGSLDERLARVENAVRATSPDAGKKLQRLEKSLEDKIQRVEKVIMAGNSEGGREASPQPRSVNEKKEKKKDKRRDNDSPSSHPQGTAQGWAYNTREVFGHGLEEMSPAGRQYLSDDELDELPARRTSFAETLEAEPTTPGKAETIWPKDAQPAVSLHFPNAQWPAHPRFEREIRKGLARVGAKKAASTIVLRLKPPRQGGIMAELLGSVAEVDELREAALEELVVLQYPVGDVRWDPQVADVRSAKARRDRELGQNLDALDSGDELKHMHTQLKANRNEAERERVLQRGEEDSRRRDNHQKELERKIRELEESKSARSADKDKRRRELQQRLDALVKESEEKQRKLEGQVTALERELQELDVKSKEKDEIRIQLSQLGKQRDDLENEHLEKQALRANELRTLEERMKAVTKMGKSPRDTKRDQDEIKKRKLELAMENDEDENFLAREKEVLDKKIAKIEKRGKDKPDFDGKRAELKERRQALVSQIQEEKRKMQKEADKLRKLILAVDADDPIENQKATLERQLDSLVREDREDKSFRLKESREIEYEMKEAELAHRVEEEQRRHLDETRRLEEQRRREKEVFERRLQELEEGRNRDREEMEKQISDAKRHGEKMMQQEFLKRRQEKQELEWKVRELEASKVELELEVSRREDAAMKIQASRRASIARRGQDESQMPASSRSQPKDIERMELRLQQLESHMFQAGAANRQNVPSENTTSRQNVASQNTTLPGTNISDRLNLVESLTREISAEDGQDALALRTTSLLQTLRRLYSAASTASSVFVSANSPYQLYDNVISEPMQLGQTDKTVKGGEQARTFRQSPRNAHEVQEDARPESRMLHSGEKRTRRDPMIRADGRTNLAKRSTNDQGTTMEVQELPSDDVYVHSPSADQIPLESAVAFRKAEKKRSAGPKPKPIQEFQLIYQTPHTKTLSPRRESMDQDQRHETPRRAEKKRSAGPKPKQKEKRTGKDVVTEGILHESSGDDADRKEYGNLNRVEANEWQPGPPRLDAATREAQEVDARDKVVSSLYSWGQEATRTNGGESISMQDSFEDMNESPDTEGGRLAQKRAKQKAFEEQAREKASRVTVGTVLRCTLPHGQERADIFESCRSENVIGSVAENDKVTAAKLPQIADGYFMVQIAPEGAVDLHFFEVASSAPSSPAGSGSESDELRENSYIQEDQRSAVHVSPSAASSSPRAAKASPRAANLSPRAASSSSRAASNSPQAANASPRAANSSPRSASSSPRAANSSPRAANSSPRAANSSPRAAHSDLDKDSNQNLQEEEFRVGSDVEELGMTPTVPPGEVVVTKLVKGGWADVSGIRRRDKIISVNGIDVAAMGKLDFLDAMGQRPLQFVVAFGAEGEGDSSSGSELSDRSSRQSQDRRSEGERKEEDDDDSENISERDRKQDRHRGHDSDSDRSDVGSGQSQRSSQSRGSQPSSDSRQDKRRNTNDSYSRSGGSDNSNSGKSGRSRALYCHASLNVWTKGLSHIKEIGKSLCLLHEKLSMTTIRRWPMSDEILKKHICVDVEAPRAPLRQIVIDICHGMAPTDAQPSSPSESGERSADSDSIASQSNSNSSHDDAVQERQDTSSNSSDDRESAGLSDRRSQDSGSRRQSKSDAGSHQSQPFLDRRPSDCIPQGDGPRRSVVSGASRDSVGKSDADSYQGSQVFADRQPPDHAPQEDSLRQSVLSAAIRDSIGLRSPSSSLVDVRSSQMQVGMTLLCNDLEADVFESTDMHEVIGLVVAGDQVTVAGRSIRVNDTLMVPIQPRGFVDSGAFKLISFDGENLSRSSTSEKARAEGKPNLLSPPSSIDKRTSQEERDRQRILEDMSSVEDDAFRIDFGTVLECIPPEEETNVEVFESFESLNVIGLIEAGERVTAAGRSILMNGIEMVPIQPRGVVEKDCFEVFSITKTTEKDQGKSKGVHRKSEASSMLSPARSKVAPMPKTRRSKKRDSGSSGNDASLVVAGTVLLCEASDDDSGHHAEVFEEVGSNEVIGLIVAGENVTAAGRAVVIDEVAMVPIKPRGAVELHHFKFFPMNSERKPGSKPKSPRAVKQHLPGDLHEQEPDVEDLEDNQFKSEQERFQFAKLKLDEEVAILKTMVEEKDVALSSVKEVFQEQIELEKLRLNRELAILKTTVEEKDVALSSVKDAFQDTVERHTSAAASKIQLHWRWRCALRENDEQQYILMKQKQASYLEARRREIERSVKKKHMAWAKEKEEIQQAIKGAEKIQKEERARARKMAVDRKCKDFDIKLEKVRTAAESKLREIEELQEEMETITYFRETSAIKIQSWWRGEMARLDYFELKKTRINAALIIQSARRRQLLRRIVWEVVHLRIASDAEDSEEEARTRMSHSDKGDTSNSDHDQDGGATKSTKRLSMGSPRGESHASQGDDTREENHKVGQRFGGKGRSDQDPLITSGTESDDGGEGLALCTVREQDMDGKPHRMKDPEGDWGCFYGSLNDEGRADGKGKLKYDDGDTFVGDFVDGVMLEGVCFGRSGKPKFTMKNHAWTRTVDTSIVDKYLQVRNDEEDSEEEEEHVAVFVTDTDLRHILLDRRQRDMRPQRKVRPSAEGLAIERKKREEENLSTRDTRSGSLPIPKVLRRRAARIDKARASLQRWHKEQQNVPDQPHVRLFLRLLGELSQESAKSYRSWRANERVAKLCRVPDRHKKEPEVRPTSGSPQRRRRELEQARQREGEEQKFAKDAMWERACKWHASQNGPQSLSPEIYTRLCCDHAHTKPRNAKHVPSSASLSNDATDPFFEDLGDWLNVRKDRALGNDMPEVSKLISQLASQLGSMGPGFTSAIDEGLRWHRQGPPPTKFIETLHEDAAKFKRLSGQLEQMVLELPAGTSGELARLIGALDAHEDSKDGCDYASVCMRLNAIEAFTNDRDTLEAIEACTSDRDSE